MAGLLVVGCFPRFNTPTIPGPGAAALREMTEAAAAGSAQIALRIEVDTAREAVVILAGPFRLPPTDSTAARAAHAAMDVADHLVSRIRFDWPVSGWVRGYQLDLYDPSGRPAPSSLVHHFVVTNFDRRQFAYPTAEKLVGVGRETGSVDLPVTLGVPLSPGQRIGMMAAFHNEAATRVDVFLRLVLRWTPRDGRQAPTAVMPVDLDVNNVPGTTSAYDLPAGRSSRAYEFEAPVGGRLLAISGHLHDYGVAVRLEDAETNRTVAEVRGILDEGRHIVRVEQKKWIGLFGQGIRLRGGRRYRLVGDYDNTGRDTVRTGAMAQMIAVLAPDDWLEWPTLDSTDRDYQMDVASWRLDLTSEEYMRSGWGAPMTRVQ